MPEMSSCLNLVEAVKLASVELALVQFAAGCTNVGIAPTWITTMFYDKKLVFLVCISFENSCENPP
jgi:hypothetical protein